MAAVSQRTMRVEAYGTVDELNCAIGTILSAANLPQAIATAKRFVAAGAFVCSTGRRRAELAKALAVIAANAVAIQADGKSDP